MTQTLERHLPDVLHDVRAEAEATLADGLLPDGAGDWPAALVALGLIAWDEGRIVDAVGLLRAAVSRADAESGAGFDARLALAALLVAIGELDEGAPEGAWTRLPPDAPAAAPSRVRDSLAANDRRRAEAVVRGAELVAAQNFGLPALDAAARHARGLLEHDADALRHAAECQRHARARASAHEDAGEIFSAQDRTAAFAAFGQALAAYEEAGAERDAARVRARLVDLKARNRSRRPDRPRWGWISLTDAERRVAEVVAEGLTNAAAADRLFLSRHTVDFHLRQIYRKLEISSRVELTRLVLAQDSRARSH